MFEKSLQDLVKGIRAHKKTESKYIAGAIEEIKKELSELVKATQLHAYANRIRRADTDPVRSLCARTLSIDRRSTLCDGRRGRRAQGQERARGRRGFARLAC